MVERDFAELIHQNCSARQGVHEVIEDRGFAAAEKASQEGDGYGLVAHEKKMAAQVVVV